LILLRADARGSEDLVVGARLDRDELRGAVYRADVDALWAALTDRIWPADALQLVGDGLLAVAAVGQRDVEHAARECVRQLLDRRWDGDADLAAQIESVFGWGPAPLLRELRVDLEELAGVLEGDPVMGGGRIDRRSGEVWPQAALEYAEELDEEFGDDEDEDDERWLYVHSEGSRAGYRDIELFIDSLEDARVADRLFRSIQGPRAFRRFKDALAEWPDLLERWYGFSDERHRGRARAWLAAEGLVPALPCPEG
jgi:hypothetical protein